MTKLIAIALLASVTLASAQDYTVRPEPLGGGYSTYNHYGTLINTTRPEPLGGGYGVYSPQGQQIQIIRPEPLGGGWRVHTMPSYGRTW